VVCTEGANFDGTWWYASWACENYGVYPGCGRPQLELPFAVNMYWFALNWGGLTYIGDCIDYGWVVAICRIQANSNQKCLIHYNFCAPNYWSACTNYIIDRCIWKLFTESWSHYNSATYNNF
jgi:hypothetical protein